MDYKESLRYVTEFLNNNKSLYYFNGDEIVILKNGLSCMTKTIELLQNNDVKECDDGVIVQSLSVIKNQLLYRVIDGTVALFIRGYLSIITNMNDNLINKSNEITKHLIIINDIHNNHLRITDNINIMECMINELKGYVSIKPPSYELSGHYLESINRRLCNE